MPKPIITQIAVNENGAGANNLRGGDSLFFARPERNFLRFFHPAALYKNALIA
ncbi:MAG: hypothetical protein R2788_22145 [Saprospiraceae bacterium]